MQKYHIQTIITHRGEVSYLHDIDQTDFVGKLPGLCLHLCGKKCGKPDRKEFYVRHTQPYLHLDASWRCPTVASLCAMKNSDGVNYLRIKPIRSHYKMTKPLGALLMERVRH